MLVIRVYVVLMLFQIFIFMFVFKFEEFAMSINWKYNTPVQTMIHTNTYKKNSYIIKFLKAFMHSHTPRYGCAKANESTVYVIWYVTSTYR